VMAAVFSHKPKTQSTCATCLDCANPVLDRNNLSSRGASPTILVLGALVV
jgi:hypothetical protein